MEVSIVYKERKICADFCHEEKNCPYVKVVEEHGEYLVTTFQAKEKGGILDLTTMHNVRTRVDTTSFCAYCTHPHYSEEKFIGSVEPYLACFAPSSCPKLQEHCETATTKKITLFQIIKNILKK